MAFLNIGLVAAPTGITILSLNFSAARVGVGPASARFRIRRTHETEPTVYLLGLPELVFGPDRDIKSWLWVDPSIPSAGMYTYTLEIMKLAGDATFYEMIFFGQHLKR